MFTQTTQTFSKPLSALLAAVAVGAVALPAFAGGAAPASRKQVREELRMWKTTNMMSQSGEISEPAAVLEQREAFYSLQSDVLGEESLAAWQQWQLAQDGSTPVVLMVFEAE